MNIEVNSERSYLGKDIKAWCMADTEDANALEIKRKYYSDEVEFKPSDRVYYFVDYVSTAESYKECGSLNMCGCHLHRDLEKSPRKIMIRKKHKRKNEIKLGKNEEFTEDVHPNNGKCPKCGGILVTNFGAGISCTFCVDCDYNDYDYD